MVNFAIQQLIETGESEMAEFKISASDNHLNAIGKTVCAFLNTKGGTLLVGVADNREIIGVKDAEQLTETIKEHLLKNISPLSSWSINAVEVDNKKIIAIDVPQGSDNPYAYTNGIFVRKGAASIAADNEEISRLINQRHLEGGRWERLPALGFEIDDLDLNEIKQTATEAILRQRYKFENPNDPLTVLEQLGLVSNGMILNSAVVLFGKNPALRYPQIRVKAARFKGESVLAPFIDNRTFEGHAFALVEQIGKFIQTHNPISSQLPTKGFQRSDKSAYPWEALREAILNAIVHRDYAAFDGSISIGIYDNRIEIWNSGSLPNGMTVSDLKKEHPSRPHNPDIANVFFLRGQIERWGIGTRQIVARCVEAGLPEPEWRDASGGVTIIIRLQKEFRTKLNERQKNLLKSLKVGDKVIPKEYVVAAKVAERRARQDLLELAKAGYLISEGKGRTTFYVRTDKLIS
jgi:ATP-dependent DNA helicase RecG